MVAGLSDDITIICIPVVLGKGRALFSNMYRDIPLEPIGTQVHNFGFVSNTYQLAWFV